MMIEVDRVIKKELFLISLLEQYFGNNKSVYLNIHKGINIKTFFKFFFTLHGQFINASLFPVFLTFYIKVDVRTILKLKETKFNKNLKWNIIDKANDRCLAFNYYNAEKPILEVNDRDELDDLENFLKQMIENGVITHYNIITDD